MSPLHLAAAHSSEEVVAALLKRIGITQSDLLVEVQRDQLVAGYVGQTAPKTQEKIDEEVPHLSKCALTLTLTPTLTLIDEEAPHLSTRRPLRQPRQRGRLQAPHVLKAPAPAAEHRRHSRIAQRAHARRPDHRRRQVEHEPPRPLVLRDHHRRLPTARAASKRYS